jgi:hypothetical protein
MQRVASYFCSSECISRFSTESSRTQIAASFVALQEKFKFWLATKYMTGKSLQIPKEYKPDLLMVGGHPIPQIGVGPLC